MADPIPHARAGDVFTFKKQDWTVAVKCDDTGATGSWVCTTHGESFPHLAALSGHVSKVCVIAWNCHTHGPEVP